MTFERYTTRDESGTPISLLGLCQRQDYFELQDEKINSFYTHKKKTKKRYGFVGKY